MSAVLVPGVSDVTAVGYAANRCSVAARTRHPHPRVDAETSCTPKTAVDRWGVVHRRHAQPRSPLARVQPRGHRLGGRSSRSRRQPRAAMRSEHRRGRSASTSTILALRSLGRRGLKKLLLPVSQGAVTQHPSSRPPNHALSTPARLGCATRLARSAARSAPRRLPAPVTSIARALVVAPSSPTDHSVSSLPSGGSPLERLAVERIAQGSSASSSGSRGVRCRRTARPRGDPDGQRAHQRLAAHVVVEPIGDLRASHPPRAASPTGCAIPARAATSRATADSVPGQLAPARRVIEVLPRRKQRRPAPSRAQ